MDKFRIVIASLPQRERCVAEIYYDHIQWVEISHETDDINDIVFRFCNHPTRKYWEFDYYEAMKVLEKAKKRLLEE